MDDFVKNRILRKHALAVVEILLSRCVNYVELTEYAEYIEKQDFIDLIVERSLNNLCGNPMCGNPKVYKFKSKYSIDMPKQKIYDNSEISKFCRLDCLQKAYSFCEISIPDTPLWTRSKCLEYLEDLNSAKQI
ncbi:unnamed protein product [Gordionus sp. m RMFG-2023]